MYSYWVSTVISASAGDIFIHYVLTVGVDTTLPSQEVGTAADDNRIEGTTKESRNDQLHC